jgi:hypothetical protein
MRLKSLLSNNFVLLKLYLTIAGTHIISVAIRMKTRITHFSKNLILDLEEFNINEQHYRSLNLQRINYILLNGISER